MMRNIQGRMAALERGGHTQDVLGRQVYARLAAGETIQDLTDDELRVYREDLADRLRRQGVHVPALPDVTVMSDDELTAYRATLAAKRHAAQVGGQT